MKHTTIIELDTEKQVRDFCRELLEFKKMCPGSLKFIIGITAKRDTTERRVKIKKKIPDNILKYKLNQLEKLIKR